MANTGNERRLITSAVEELICKDESCLEKGVSFVQLSRVAKNKSQRLTRKQIENVIHREISSGSLVRLPSGNLALRQADNDDSNDSIKGYDSNNKMTSSHSSGSVSPQQRRGRPKKRSGESVGSTTRSAVRVGVRRKMAKKVFDPSDNNVPIKRKRGRPTGSFGKAKRNKRDNTSTRSESRCSNDSIDVDEHDDVSNVSEEAETRIGGGVCSVCLTQKSRGSDRLVECQDCSNKAHSSCIQSGSGMLKLQADNGWQCPHCKTCVVCCETNDAGMLTVCSVCSDAYHALCHIPTISQEMTAWDQWECSNCQNLSLPVSRPSPLQRHKSPTDPFMKPFERDIAKQLDDIPIDPSIPDIKDWTSEDVYKYFQEHLPEVAHVFKNQDMDGEALSMARRVDIVKHLGLLLGPALTLYRHVLRLQTRKDDFSMCWG